jgi:hypothetical protein
MCAKGSRLELTAEFWMTEKVTAALRALKEDEMPTRFWEKLRGGQ